MNVFDQVRPRWDWDHDPAGRYAQISFGDIGLGFIDDAVESIGGHVSRVVKNIWDIHEDLWDTVTDEFERAWESDLFKAAVIGAAIYFSGPAGANWWGGASTGAGATASNAAVLAETGVQGAAGAAGAAGSAGATSAATTAATTTATNQVAQAAAMNALEGAAVQGAGGAATGAATGAGSAATAGAAELSAFGGANAAEAAALSGQYAAGGATSVSSAMSTAGAESPWWDALWPDSELGQFAAIQTGGQMLAGLFSPEPPGPDDAARARRDRFEVNRYGGFSPRQPGQVQRPGQPDPATAGGYQPFSGDTPRQRNGLLLSRADQIRTRGRY